MISRDESTATLLQDRSPLSTQRSRLNLNSIMDAYNNLNKHPSVMAFAGNSPNTMREEIIDEEELRKMAMFAQTPRESAVSINPYEIPSP